MTDELNITNGQETGQPETPASPPAELATDGSTAVPATTPVEAPGESPTAHSAPEAVASPELPSTPAETPGEQAPQGEAKSDKMDWYILKVQSNREDSIREGLMRRVAIAGLGYFFGEVIVPIEKVTEFKGGKKKVIKRKLYPGYLVVHMEINEDTWFLVRETPGIGDFTGAAGRPSPMLPHEVAKIVAKQEEKSEKAPKLKIAFREGERVKIKEGTFENFEGDVDSIDETNGRVTVMINIFGRSTPVELEYWQIEAL
ncbi:MAG: transcription termination/antitermination protein NusG [Thermoguttaceae bacterium]